MNTPPDTLQSGELAPRETNGVRLEVQAVNPGSTANWNELLQTHGEYSFFHTAEWAKVLQETYGYEPNYFLVRDGGRLRALLPVMKVNSLLTGRRGIALPFTDECSLLYEESPWGRRLVQSAVSWGKSDGWKSVELRGAKKLFPDAPAAVSYYGHRLDLEKREVELFASLDNSTRRAIRKAEKSGVTVTLSGGTDAMKEFYSLHCRTRRRHGLPPQPFVFFSKICRHILSRNLGTVAVGRWRNRPIAAAVYFRLGTRAIYKFGASDESFQELRGASLVMWQGIRHLARSGAKTLDFGRTSLGNEGLRRFKLNWGAQEYRIEYLKYDLRRNAFVTETDSATGWYNWIFRTLPTGISRMVGAILYGHLA